MRKYILGLAAALSLVGFAAQANVETEAVSAPLYTCKLRGHISGGSIAIFIGGQVLQGPGTITCTQNITGETYRTPVEMKLVGGGVGFELSKIRRTEVYSAGIGVNDPRFFYRSFAVGATAGASLVRVGLGFDAALRLSDGGVGFDVGLKGQDIVGLGAHLYGMVFSIEPR